jgi:uncharacterized protein
MTSGVTSAVTSDVTSAERIATAFVHVLRSAGVTVPLDAVLTFVEALGVVGLDDRDRVYWAARATLLRRPEDIAPFDEAFAAFFERRTSEDAANAPQTVRLTMGVDEGVDGDEGDGEPAAEPDIVLRFSAAEVLRTKDFAEYTDDELVEAQRLMSRLRLAGPPRRSLRLVAGRRSDRHVDLRRTVASALRAEGEVIRFHHRSPARRLRRLVLVLDVSGSMEPYARALLRFVHAAVSGRQRVEAFALGTRLTRLTKELTTRDPDIAIGRASTSVVDWSGGTRLGEGLRHFNDEWAVRGMARGAIVVILSDGWDRGEPELLAEQMARLSRVAERIVWVNPLKVTPGYAPLARGMAAALPYVDDFVEGHSVSALEELAAVIADCGVDGTRTTDRTKRRTA